MAIQVSKANGRDICAIMPVERHIKERGYRKSDRTPATEPPTRWISADLQLHCRPLLDERRLDGLKGSVIVAKDKSGRMVGYGLVIGESEGAAYKGAEDGSNFFEKLPATDDTKADRPGHFQIAYRKDAPESAIRSLLTAVVKKARKHPEISMIYSHIQKELANLAGKLGFEVIPDSEDIFCRIRFEGKECTPRTTTIALPHYPGKQVPDTIANRERKETEILVMRLDAAITEKMKDDGTYTSAAYYSYLNG